MEGAQHAKPYEGVMTVGMRGSGDTTMSAGIGTSMLDNIVQTRADFDRRMWVSGMRQVAITCRRGTSVARSPKLLALPYPFLESIEYTTLY